MTKLLTILLIAAPLTFSATIVQTVTCSTEGLPTIAGTTDCIGLASEAHTAVSLQLATNPLEYSTLSGFSRTKAITANNEHYPGTPTYAQADATLTDTLTTSGFVRPGFMIAEISGGSDHNGNETGSIVSMTVPFLLPFQTITCLGGLGDQSCSGFTGILRHYDPIPFTLGQAFSIFYTGNAYAFANSPYGGGSSESGLTFLFRLTELDGTPVALTETPEPTTSGLGIIAVLAGAIARMITRHSHVRFERATRLIEK